MNINGTQLNKMKRHFIKCYPNEGVMILVNGKLIPVDNIHPDPLNHFRIDSDILINNEVEAIIHSHIHIAHGDVDPRTPSACDLNGQKDTAVPWGICSVDDKMCSDILWFPASKDEPLEGRPFIHGVFDCYSIINHYYHQNRGVELMDYPRDYEWWHNKDNLYVDNYAKEGFVDIHESELQEGDVLLMKIRADVSNHAAIYLGSNQILHHIMGRVSYKDKYSRWKKYVSHCLRYNGNVEND